MCTSADSAVSKKALTSHGDIAPTRSRAFFDDIQWAQPTLAIKWPQKGLVFFIHNKPPPPAVVYSIRLFPHRATAPGSVLALTKGDSLTAPVPLDTATTEKERYKRIQQRRTMDCAQEYKQEKKDSGLAAAPVTDQVRERGENRGSTPPPASAPCGPVPRWRWYESRQLWLELRILAMGLIVAAIIISFMPPQTGTPAPTTAPQPATSPTLAAAQIIQKPASSSLPAHELSCLCPCRGGDGNMVEGQIIRRGHRGHCLCSCPLEVSLEKQATDAFYEKAGVVCLFFFLVPLTVVLMFKYSFHM
nr:hypothetical protein [Pandoravirus massiliensis]